MSNYGIAPAGLSSLQVAELSTPAPNAVVSLESRLIQGLAKSAVGTEQDYAKINGMLDRPDITNPEVLSQMQIMMAQYNIDVSLLNVLVRKTVSTAETLLRSS
ncbi:type III secretion system inner rod subunit SctI [Pseudomonas sp. Y24-6]|uniref:type III secretion system inner rod subunit SctI n=1 Tax=Pseudomonas sp. Y24-6 TaxID=2750013 RepID=UPI001CE12D64|nr:type III secretion system inner rod subunit SctI [Pseudomonas sp. Y24-6]MCA4963417.1 type III secretion system inner rod subunit SctI [Pseudomonas sp. Y24-6]